MPFRDRAGRRILTIFPGAELENIPPNTHVSKTSTVQYSIV